MLNFIKRYILNRKFFKGINGQQLKSYPQSVLKVALVCDADKEVDANLITKLKSNLDSNTQFFIFVLSKKKRNLENAIIVNMKSFNYFGDLKDKSSIKILKQLDMLIDISEDRSIINQYLLSTAYKAYSISLGNDLERKYNLSINLKEFNQELFGNEIIKYHKILSHANR